MFWIKLFALSCVLFQTQNVLGSSSAGATLPPRPSTQSPTTLSPTSSNASTSSLHASSNHVTTLNGLSSTQKPTSAGYTSAVSKKPISKVTTSRPTTKTRSTFTTTKAAPTTRPTASSTPEAVEISRTTIQRQLVASVFAVAAVSGLLVASVALMTIRLVGNARIKLLKKDDTRDRRPSQFEMDHYGNGRQVSGRYRRDSYYEGEDNNGVRFSEFEEQTYPKKIYQEEENINYGDESEITTSF